MSKKTVQDVFDTRLSGIEVTENHKRAIMQQIYEEEQPVKRKISTSVVVALLMAVLLAATAVAAHLYTRSAQADAIQEARQALIETYGLTPSTLGLFRSDTAQSDGAWTVTFTPFAAEMFDKDRIGSYSVVLKDETVAQITWTHDDVDAAEWKDKGLEALVWGQSQMLEALTLQESQNVAKAAAAREREDQEREAAAAEPSSLTSEQQAQALTSANQALVEEFGFSAETLTLFKTKILHPSETHGDGFMTVCYAPGYANAKGEFSSKMGSYFVTSDTESGEIVDVVWSEADIWDDKAYTQSNWGSASAFHAKLLPWAVELQKTVDAITAPYGGLEGEGMNFIDAAAYDQAFRDAGFAADEGYHREAPGEDEITYEVALTIAKAALVQDTGIAEDELRSSGLSAERVVEDDGTPKYSFMFTVYKDGFGAVYNVFMDAHTGEIEYMGVEAGGVG